MNTKQQKISTFERAVKATPDVSDSYQKGLDAFGVYKVKIKVPDSKKIDGSLDIDAATVQSYPHDNRWDYALCYDGEVFYIEVHSAITSEVSKMIQKLQWLKKWLFEKAPAINKLTTKTKSPYYWIQSSNNSIPKHTPQYRRVVQNKIRPMPIWDYDIICRN